MSRPLIAPENAKNAGIYLGVTSLVLAGVPAGANLPENGVTGMWKSFVVGNQFADEWPNDTIRKWL
jgi:hypothetical protein